MYCCSCILRVKLRETGTGWHRSRAVRAVRAALPKPVARAAQDVRASFWCVPPGYAKRVHYHRGFKFKRTRCPQFGCTGERQNHEPQCEARSRITVISGERMHKGRYPTVDGGLRISGEMMNLAIFDGYPRY